MTIRNICLSASIAVAALIGISAPASAKKAPRTIEVVARITGIDLQRKSIQVEFGTPQFQTFLVIGKAAERLEELPIGSMFKLTLQTHDDSAGQVVIEIQKAKNPPKAPRDRGVVDQS